MLEGSEYSNMHMLHRDLAAEFAYAESQNDSYDTIKALVVKEHIDAVLQPK